LASRYVKFGINGYEWFGVVRCDVTEAIGGICGIPTAFQNDIDMFGDFIYVVGQDAAWPVRAICYVASGENFIDAHVASSHGAFVKTFGYEAASNYSYMYHTIYLTLFSDKIKHIKVKCPAIK
jgi:hypothetical protein